MPKVPPAVRFPGVTMRKNEQGHAAPDGAGTITIRDVRCACAVCGTHLVAWQGHALTGWCENCGSYDVRALPAAVR
jgi:Zn finger protein HypA/HybF involved in hydrogenase expression